jgi:hypothetical protein
MVFCNTDSYTYILKLSLDNIRQKRNEKRVYVKGYFYKWMDVKTVYLY